MTHRHRIGILSLTIATVLLNGKAGFAQSETSAARPAISRNFEADTKTGTLSRGQILRLLCLEIDVSDLSRRKEAMKLREVLKVIRDRVKQTKRVEVPMFVNVDQFKIENPDAPHVEDTDVRFPAAYRRMTVAEAIRLALAKIPTKNGTFLVRRGVLEITTADCSSPIELVHRKILVSFNGCSVNAAIKELQEQTGANIVVDPNLGNTPEKTVRLDLANNATLGQALVVLTRLVGAEPIILGDVIYITTPASARELRPWQLRLQPPRQPEPMVPGLELGV